MKKILYSEDKLYYIKKGLRDNVVSVCELGWKTSCSFYDLSETKKNIAIKELSEKYKFDKKNLRFYR